MICVAREGWESCTQLNVKLINFVVILGNLIANRLISRGVMCGIHSCVQTTFFQLGRPDQNSI